MHGTWTTTGGGGIGPPKELIWAVVVGCAGVGAGLAVYTFVLAVLPLLVIAALVLVLAAVAGTVAFALYRHRHPEAVARLHERAVRPPTLHILAPEPEPKALPQPQPAAIYFGGQHVHVQPGADLSALTEALRTRDAITVETKEI